MAHLRKPGAELTNGQIATGISKRECLDPKLADAALDPRCFALEDGPSIAEQKQVAAQVTSRSSLVNSEFAPSNLHLWAVAKNVSLEPRLGRGVCLRRFDDSLGNVSGEDPAQSQCPRWTTAATAPRRVPADFAPPTSTTGSGSWPGGKASACASTPGPAARQLPAVVHAMEALPLRSAVLDGEGVIWDPDGKSDFDRMRAAGFNSRITPSAGSPVSSVHLRKQHGLVFKAVPPRHFRTYTRCALQLQVSGDHRNETAQASVCSYTAGIGAVMTELFVTCPECGLREELTHGHAEVDDPRRQCNHLLKPAKCPALRLPLISARRIFDFLDWEMLAADEEIPIAPSFAEASIVPDMPEPSRPSAGSGNVDMEETTATAERHADPEPAGAS